MSKPFLSRSCFHQALPWLLAVLLAGCATQKIDWAGRVGHFTFDQAALEFGPPDKQAKLGDGTVIADWMTQHGRTYTRVNSGYANPGWYSGPIVETSLPDYFLRLNFGPDGQLKSWKKFAR